MVSSTLARSCLDAVLSLIIGQFSFIISHPLSPSRHPDKDRQNHLFCHGAIYGTSD
jgi:hypothetical protein